MAVLLAAFPGFRPVAQRLSSRSNAKVIELPLNDSPAAPRLQLRDSAGFAPASLNRAALFDLTCGGYNARASTARPHRQAAPPGRTARPHRAIRRLHRATTWPN